LLYQKLGDRYPTEPVADSPAFFPPSVPGLQLLVGSGVPGRVRLSTKDGLGFLFIVQPAISINCLRPYPGWETFLERITEALVAFSEIHPQFEIERIGLRYINRLDASMENLPEYFDVRPLNFSAMNLNLANFVCRSEMLFEGDPKRLLIATFGSVRPVVGAEQAPPLFTLDLDTIGQSLEGITSVEAALNVVNDLRLIEKRAFEAAITEKARTELFGGYESKGNA
jgi:uncharacterized protein (TIGR04255 family)